MHRPPAVPLAFALTLALLTGAAARATTVFCVDTVSELYGAFAAGNFVNDDVEVRIVAGTYWLDRELRFDNQFGRRLELLGGYGSYSGGQCNLRRWDSRLTVLRSVYVTGFDVRLYSGRRIEVENLSFYELDEVVLDLHGGHADIAMNMVRIEGTGGLTIDTTDADNSTVDLWNLAILRSYEAPAAKMILDNTDFTMIYGTIYDNDRTSATIGGLEFDSDGNSQLTVSRSVIWDNGPVDFYVDDDAPDGWYNIIDIIDRENDSTPIFMGWTQVDPRLDYDGAPLANSPCINGATQSTSILRDLIGRVRVSWNRSDIGAFEGPLD
ncbi:MAG: hypothetical protein ABIV06_10180 [Thermoanaerobaculia bacterium]